MITYKLGVVNLKTFSVFILISSIIFVMILSILSILELKNIFGNVESIDYKGEERKFIVHLPRGYQKNQNYPVVFALHGYGDNPRYIEAYSGLSRLSDKEKFIVVYPYGTKNEEIPRLSWNSGYCCGSAFESKKDDLGFLSSLIDHVNSNFSTDKERVFFTGFSNGGMVAYQMALNYPEKIRAIAPVSSTMNGRTQNSTFIELKNTNKTIPVIFFHAKGDKTIAYNDNYKTTNDLQFASVDFTIDFWKENNKVVREESENINEMDLSYKYFDENGKLVLQFVSIEESSHLWFGGLIDYQKLFKKDKVNSSQMIWEFFKSS